MKDQNLVLKKMGVMNITPNSFSDGGELHSEEAICLRLNQFKHVDALDLGAESTAPMNGPISWEEEWERLLPVLLLLKSFKGALSFDTYHSETMERILQFITDHHFTQEIIWNDVSGKFDDSVLDFLSVSSKFHYVFCHNLAPQRNLSGKHMNYVSGDLDLASLAHYFEGFQRPQVIFDPCLGFSKTYEQNWLILDHFSDLQKMIRHNRWLLGFSRKSFLRKKFGMELADREGIDRIHQKIVEDLRKSSSGELWIRTHRPDL